MNFSSFVSIICILLFQISCTKEKQRFELLDASATGVGFVNTLVESPQLNIFTYLYFYNGGGVAAGDLNGDGLPDLYFTSNQESNRLYMNKGDFKFDDITDQSGVGGLIGWTTGVTMADVNGDGKLDIYVSMVGDFLHLRGKNQLFINMGNNEYGIPVFEDQAKQWGLDLIGFSTQAAFFDYDLDGDLDMFMLNHSVHSNGTFGRSTIRKEVHPLAGDKLFRNDGNSFSNVTHEAGIFSSALGYGLGVSIGDLNWDGYPDIYVGNDFHEDDYLYLNNGDGTFTECLGSAIRYTSRFSMGNDIGDINNDGLNDIISTDMLPGDPYMLKTAAGEDGFDVYNMKMGFGYKDQFARNTLQLNIGNAKFSEIGLLSGVYATDWSWSALIADLDLDGLNDIYITNGIKRRSNDNDYINFISNETIQSRLEGDLSDEDLMLVEKMPVIKIPNYAFKNSGELLFTNVSTSWGLNHESFSNGAAYVDLDNDGDLDIVVNNVDQPAFIYRNNTISKSGKENNFIKLVFRGEGLNRYGIGTKVIVPLADEKIIRELYTTRGYQSSVSPEIIVGVGKKEIIDTMYVIWPDHKYQVFTNVKVNQTLTIDKSGAVDTYTFPNPINGVFSNLTDSISIDYRHQENRFVEFNREGLIPHMASTEGPKMAIGDVNGDGLDDLYVCGAKHQKGALILQTKNGFVTTYPEVLGRDSVMEDTDAHFFDVDSDGDLDLVVLSGGNEFRGKSENLAIRLYENDGSGKFTRQISAFDGVFLNGSCLRPFDFDNDGHVDLFVGGRVVPWNYGAPPESYLLKNDGTGTFVDVTKEFAPELSGVGMVKDAHWSDLNNDGQSDLVLVGEWMPITFFIAENGKWKKQVPKSLSKTNGWWNSVLLADIDNDGDVDIVAGNLGLNSKLTASFDRPVTAYINDFDGNERTELLIYYFLEDKEILFPTRDELVKQIPSIKKQYLTNADFAAANPKEIVGKSLLAKAKKLYCYELRSGIFINNGNYDFTFEPFPISAQVSPLNSMYILDYDGDNYQDLLLAGNFFEVNIQRGKYNSSYGSLLRNLGNGKFDGINNEFSGLYLNGQIRDIKTLKYRGKEILLLGRNNDSIQVIVTR
ncbi:MAG: VCBS repeat-containing protein [Cyclobacteriaceae bacterium]|nr:VCBS repeat-containing protein [Cyclobacteriaceae bacterium]